jgi:hypothetical protein
VNPLTAGPILAVRGAVALVDLPARLEAILTRTENALSRIERLVGDAEGVAGSAAASAARSAEVVGQASDVAARADALVGRVEKIAENYGDSLSKLAPLAREAAGALTPEHVRSAARLVEQVPEVVELLAPAMRGLAALAPDLDELLDRLNAVGEIVEGLPGASLLRRRGQTAEDDGEMRP